MLIIQIKFKCASSLWQFHCKQHKTMEEIFLEYSRTIIWFNKEVIHIIDEWVGFLCICYFIFILPLTVTENINSHSCSNTTHSSVGTISKLLIHKFSKTSTKAFWGNQLTLSDLWYRIFYILILFRNRVLHVLYIKLAIFFLKGRIVNTLGPTVHHNCSTLPLQQESNHRWYEKEWARLCYNKVIFTKPQCHSLLTYAFYQ